MTMGVPSSAQLIVASTACWILREAIEDPVVEGVAQPSVARSAHRDVAALAAAARDWRYAGNSAQELVVSSGNGLRGLSEHRGGDELSDPWHGEKDLGVTVPGRLPLLA